MAKLQWDQVGQKEYEVGADMAVLYKQDSSGTYPKGVAWNGFTNFTESPSGAEETALYANNAKYGSLRSAEEFGGTLEAYTYPDEFAECNGNIEIAPGVMAGQQTRKPFGFVCRTKIGNDTEGDTHGYKYHLVYGAVASPSEVAHASINDSPEVNPLSWEITTTPVEIPGGKPSAKITIDSRNTDPSKLKEIEKILFGDEETEARLPLPQELATLMAADF